MGALTDLVLAGRRWLRVWSRGGPSKEPDRAAFRASLEALLARAPEGLVAQSGFVELPASKTPWTPTGVRLTKGEPVTLVSCGRFWLSRPLDLWTGPGFQVWGRVGGKGPLIRGTRDSHTFRAPSDGLLELASHGPGEWADHDGGAVTRPDEYAKADGGFTVLVVRWATDPEAGLEALAALGPEAALFARERERLAAGDATPYGWRYLWHLGPAEIYSRARVDGRDAITCRTEGDVGILQHGVSLALTDATRLRWSWKVDALPSAVREDSLATHDYLSIAVEFDNGQDLTYTWSATLPPDHGYACPLPDWKDRETHVVVRRGAAGLGAWHEEVRSLRADYARYIGSPAPARIVRVWLIGVSLFQRGAGCVHYADIALLDDEGVHSVR